jgi:hypothetical protein
MPGTNVYIDSPGRTLTLWTGFSCESFIFYRGELNINGKTLAATRDFIVFGEHYDPTDRDWASSNTRFDYYDALGLLFYDPNTTFRPPTPVLPTPPPISWGGTHVYSAAFAGLTPSAGVHADITVGGNFYVNGTDMIGTMQLPDRRTLTVPLTAGDDPIFNGTHAATADMW